MSTAEVQSLQKIAAQATPEFYKENLPIPFVLERAGVFLEGRGDKLSAVCPFHPDSDPSLDVWLEAGAWRFNCYPCGKGSGDVFDLIGRLHSETSFSGQMIEAQAAYADLPSDWKPPVLSGRVESWDPDVALRSVSSAQAAASGSPVIAEFLHLYGKGLGNLSADEMLETWRLGVYPDNGEIVIPYYNRSGVLVAYKHRSSQTKAISFPGSRLRDVLYGEWRDTRPDLPVILCEGESDVWAAQEAVGGSATVLGLACGAGQVPCVTGLEGRTVRLAFDGDAAGRSATQRWFAALEAAGCLVSFVPVPEGTDLASLPSDELPGLLASSRRMLPPPEGLREQGDTYVRPGKETNTMLTNWRFEPQMELRTAQGQTAYEGVLHPFGRKVTLSSHDLGTKARIVQWSSKYGVSWFGSDRDAQMLLSLLQHMGLFLPTGELVNTAGLHSRAFIWPGGHAGRTSAVYEPPQFNIHLEQRLSLSPLPWTAKQIPMLRSLHTSEVMDPVLGWLAAAPLRSLLPSFPTLAVTGSSGSGKTTLLSTVVQAFSGADISTNLTSTTKHALASFMASTNAFPVWFDEYRPGARKDTQLALEQLLRDAYTGQISAKGGLGEHWSEISAMNTDSPIIVSGEDAFTETSHTERMVNLALPSRGKNPAALLQISEWGKTGLPLAYLEWLASQLAQDALFLVPQATGPESLPPRSRDNLGTVTFGWDLLRQFCQAHNVSLPSAPDLSLVVRTAEESSDHNPIRDALRWAMEEPEASGFLRVSEGNDEVFVRVQNFVNYIQRTGSFQLPGKATAVSRYLLDLPGAHTATHSFHQKPLTCISIPYDEVALGAY